MVFVIFTTNNALEVNPNKYIAVIQHCYLETLLRIIKQGSLNFSTHGLFFAQEITMWPWGM